ncbi:MULTISPECIES: hypothetical protein [Halorubrum]|uniref:hypothetical protein n=1 Tax=Halorubrum TaxID=56688 RepID=UPI0010F4AC34|nr:MULTISPECIES: hypothetical protein [Halorubrum]TKX68263.1 hypothetical protein EXE40_13045 [Halorubrum sp. GN11GM_10-3_MGM]
MSETKFNSVAEEPVYEETMTDLPNWVVWSTTDKRPLAPWLGHLNPCRWNGNLDENERPERAFEVAKNWAGHPGTRDITHQGELGDLGIAYILPFESDASILMVDFDNVRQSDTGEVHPIVVDLLSRLSSYAEISGSGQGIHVFVRANIPDWYPGSTFSAELDTETWVDGKVPKIEMYDRARVCLTTGQHLTETPPKAARRQKIVDELIREYDQSIDTIEDICDLEERQAKPRGSTVQQGNQSPYFDVDSVDVLQRSGAQLRQQGSGYRCAHPVHGSRNGNNLGVEGEVWYCHRHNVGGNSLMLVAVLEGFITCDRAGTNSLSELEDEEFARLCLLARDWYGFDGKPPARAIRGTALAYDLISDPESQIKHIYKITRKFYDASRPEDFGKQVPTLDGTVSKRGEC